MTIFFSKVLAKSTNCEVSSLGLEFQVSSLGIFYVFSVSTFLPGLGLEDYGLVYITEFGGTTKPIY